MSEARAPWGTSLAPCLGVLLSARVSWSHCTNQRPTCSPSEGPACSPHMQALIVFAVHTSSFKVPLILMPRLP